MNGNEWYDQDLFQDVLWDPIYGAVWDLNEDRSLMHGAVGTCRCELDVEVEVDTKVLDELYECERLLRKLL